MNGALQRRLAKACGGEAVAPFEHHSEVSPLSIANQTAHVGHRDRGLIDQEIRRHAHPPREQILAEGPLAELRIGALELAGRAGQRPGHQLQGQLLAIVARDDHPRQQVQPVTS